MTATDTQPKTIFLKDYQVPDFLIERTELRFDLFEDHSRVKAELTIRRNPAGVHPAAPLVLHGVELKLLAVAIDGKVLGETDYSVDAESLTIHALGDSFTLNTEVEINPQDNTSLEGLYKSRTMFCTQCEAEGFRKITYYLDRPDVMSEFTTTVVADKATYPVLLSNGNPTERKDLEGGRHLATWHDPFMKPAYLFALVAGTLDSVDDTFTTMSGREISLQIFVETKDLDKCDHAMLSLKKSMKWDEEVYGREYDLDIFMIVAVDDFNMGAMENKGLNIFNTSCVLANPNTTTDMGFQRVEGVVAHEYFHNWSGNRVTCRDWFQLSLKEGFTVFRDSEFSSDMNSRTVKRVEDVSFLRTLQFAEDGGPMAHPVRPASYIEISNFYTLTVYEKGSEVVGMIHTLLGAATFRKGSDLYFDRHDGEASTIEHFISAMEDASGRDLTQFTRWYSQAGTPLLSVSDAYDEKSREYSLTFTQSCTSTPEASAAEKQPLVIPVALGLLGDAGNLAIKQKGAPLNSDTPDNTHTVLELTQASQTFTFSDVPEKPTPALLRGFSAPVKLNFEYSRDQLMSLMSREDDGFCRWDASQQLAVKVLHDVMTAYRAGDETPTIDARLVEAYRSVLADESLDKAMVALMLTLPSEAYLSEISEQIDVEAIHFARNYVKKQIVQALANEFIQAYRANTSEGVFSPAASEVAQRSLKNVALSYIMALETQPAIGLCVAQFKAHNNMTDVASAQAALVNTAAADTQAKACLAEFFEKWKDEALVVNQWLMVQATCSLPGGLARVRALMQHPAFDIKNPNKARSVISAFASNNPMNFHLADGSGYDFLAEQIIILNGLNPSMAARLLTPLTKWRKYDSARQTLMQAALERILNTPELSKDVFEVVTKSLKG